MEGHVKLFRKFLEWEWYMDINTKLLFIHMLLRANWKEGKFQGKIIPRGSFVSSYPKLAEETNLTIDEVRTALKHLKSTGDVTVTSHSKYSVYTVNNYCCYQDLPSQPPVIAQSVPILFPTIEEGKKVIREEEKQIYTAQKKDDVGSAQKKAGAIKHKHGEYGHVTLSDEEIHKLTVDYGDLAKDAITYLDEYVEMKGYKHKSSYLAIRKWVISAVKERQEKAVKGQAPVKPKQTGFQNFEQRDTNYDAMALERLQERLKGGEADERVDDK